MEKVTIRSPIEPMLLQILETQPVWDAKVAVATELTKTIFNSEGLPLTESERQSPLARRHDELWLLWNSVAYPLGSGNVPRHAWEDLLIEGIEVFKEFLKSGLERGGELESYQKLSKKCTERLEEWRKAPEISKLLIVYQGDD